MEVWASSEPNNTLFIHYNGKMWAELVDGVQVATFEEITHNTLKQQIGLRNVNSNAGEHTFVALNPTTAFQGSASNQLVKYATGRFTYLCNNFLKYVS